MELIVDLLYFPIPATIVVGLIAWFFLWRKGHKFLAVLAIPLFWITLIGIIASAIFFIERKSDLELQPYIAINRVFERNVNTHETSIEFYKFIKTNDNSYLMANVTIDPSLNTAIIRQDCIKLSYSETELPDPHPYTRELFDKGIGPLTPAVPNNARPIVWRFPPDVIITKDPEEIVRNLKIQISSFDSCHTLDGGYLR